MKDDWDHYEVMRTFPGITAFFIHDHIGVYPLTTTAEASTNVTQLQHVIPALVRQQCPDDRMRGARGKWKPTSEPADKPASDNKASHKSLTRSPSMTAHPPLFRTVFSATGAPHGAAADGAGGIDIDLGPVQHPNGWLIRLSATLDRENPGRLSLVTHNGQPLEELSRCSDLRSRKLLYYQVPENVSVLRLIWEKAFPETVLVEATPALDALKILINLPSFVEGEVIATMRANPEPILNLMPLWERMGDPWLYNLALSFVEYIQRKTKLESTPSRIHLPVADSCNAKCRFCSSWLTEQKVFMSPESLLPLADSLRLAHYIDLAGYGEALCNPRFGEFIDTLSGLIDPRCHLALFTNGAALERWLPQLLSMGVDIFNISVNAACAQTHNELMGLGEKSFSRIYDVIRHLVKIGQERPDINVNVSLVVTDSNIAEVADFIRIFSAAKVRHIYLRTLNYGNPFSPPSVHLLHPTQNPDYQSYKTEIIDAIAQSKVPVYSSMETWDAPIFDSLPPEAYSLQRTLPAAEMKRLGTIKEQLAAAGISLKTAAPKSETHDNPYGRKTPYDCFEPWKNMIINGKNFEMAACCHVRAEDHFVPPPLLEVGQDGAWNGAAMAGFREGMVGGDLNISCKLCPKTC